MFVCRCFLFSISRSICLFFSLFNANHSIHFLLLSLFISFLISLPPPKPPPLARFSGQETSTRRVCHPSAPLSDSHEESLHCTWYEFETIILRGKSYELISLRFHPIMR